MMVGVRILAAFVVAAAIFWILREVTTTAHPTAGMHESTSYCELSMMSYCSNVLKIHPYSKTHPLLV